MGNVRLSRVAVIPTMSAPRTSVRVQGTAHVHHSVMGHCALSHNTVGASIASMGVAVLTLRVPRVRIVEAVCATRQQPTLIPSTFVLIHLCVTKTIVYQHPLVLAVA